MLRKMLCAGIVLVVAVGFVAAAEYNGVITKVEGDKITFQEMTKGKKGMPGEKKGDPKTFTVAKDAKVVGTKFVDKKATEEEIKDGLKDERFTKISDTGVNVTLTTEGEGDKERVTKIQVRGGKKKAAAE